MVVSVKRVRTYNSDNSMNFCVGSDRSTGLTLTGAFNKIRSIYDEIMEEGDFYVPPIGFTAKKEYYSRVYSFITGELLFFVKVNPDRIMQIQTMQQVLAGVSSDF